MQIFFSLEWQKRNFDLDILVQSEKKSNWVHFEPVASFNIRWNFSVGKKIQTKFLQHFGWRFLRNFKIQTR